jgi:hypothetical protein
MQLVLQHLYTGRVDLGSLLQHSEGTNGNDGEASNEKGRREQVVQLLTAASYFLLPDLHAAVLAVVHKQLSARTALSWLQAAHAAGESALEKMAFEYARSHMQGWYRQMYFSSMLCLRQTPAQMTR